jgi:hypothetical protein
LFFHGRRALLSRYCEDFLLTLQVLNKGQKYKHWHFRSFR